MDRREFLLRGGVAIGGAVALSGCTAHRLEEAEREPPLADVRYEDLDHPGRQPLAVAGDGVERTATADVETPVDLEALLDDVGLDVAHLDEEVDEGEPILSLEYGPAETAGDGLTAHLGLVAGGYAALVAAGHDSERLEATVVDGDEVAYGEYEVRRHWAEEYDAGALTAREFAHEVLVTGETPAPEP